MITLVYFGLITLDNDLFVEALEAYLRCQGLGHLPNQTSQCNPKEYQQYTYPRVAVAHYIFLGFLTTANLTFVINWSKVIKFCTEYYHKKEKSTNVMLSTPLLPVVS